MTRAIVLLMVLAACTQDGPAPCSAVSELKLYADRDGDGHGDPADAQIFCGVAPGWVAVADDCDDSLAHQFPDNPEICDGLDNNCDGVIDDGLDVQDSWADNDNDGFGDPDDRVRSCRPQLGRVDNADDCDDSRSTANPTATEICNGLDDDCDALVDDADETLDTTGQLDFYADADGDGFGDPAQVRPGCVAPLGAVASDRDCDDLDGTVFPGATEICNGTDDDCDGLVDDADGSLDTTTAQTFFVDADEDGFGERTRSVMACAAPPGHVTDDSDCDDDDPLLGAPTEWLTDTDQDGYGVAATGDGIERCIPPAPRLAPESAGIDCDDTVATIHPDADDLCEDGLDQDCNGWDQPCVPWRSCLDVREDGVGTGVYPLEPDEGGPSWDVFCDEDVDEGGWTLVASTNLVPLRDEASGWYADLTTLTPSDPHTGIWDGMRDVMGPTSDIRFTCRNAPDDADFEVDLSFYATSWYDEITTGSDADSCFSEDNGNGYDQPAPSRRNNVIGTLILEGVDWGPLDDDVLEGEDTCTDEGDFTVDFDDRGMDGNQSDGTDWGEDDDHEKCGRVDEGSDWFIFVRERP